MESQTQPTNQPVAADLPSVPATWPGAFGLYKYSKKAVMLNIGTLIALFLTNMVAVIVLSALLGAAGRVLGNLAGAVIDVATIATLLASVRGQKVGYDAALKTLKPMLVVRYIVAVVIQTVLIALSFILLIVPFFFVFPRLLLTPYFLVDKDMDPIDAIKESWEVSKDHTGKLWGIVGATIAMALLAITIIGIPFAIYFLIMYTAATALAYEFVVRRPASALVNGPAPDSQVAS